MEPDHRLLVHSESVVQLSSSISQPACITTLYAKTQQTYRLYLHPFQLLHSNIAGGYERINAQLTSTNDCLCDVTAK